MIVTVMPCSLENFMKALVKDTSVYNGSLFKQSNSMEKFPDIFEPYSMITLPSSIQVNTKLLENFHK